MNGHVRQVAQCLLFLTALLPAFACDPQESSRNEAPRAAGDNAARKAFGFLNGLHEGQVSELVIATDGYYTTNLNGVSIAVSNMAIFDGKRYLAYYATLDQAGHLPIHIAAQDLSSGKVSVCDTGKY